jgi:O-acetyl-ADP-ribose deacetylase (regulator of RNase III)
MTGIRAIQDDIVTLQVDAIVNAANTSLLGGCETGDAKITQGHDLAARFVIHTVGPVWHGGSSGEAELLASCYRKSLALAAEHQLRTIAFPSISTGAYGYPIDLAVRIAVDTVRDVLSRSPLPDTVVFCCFSPVDLATYERTLAEADAE